MERIIKTYENFSQGELDAVKFEPGDERKLSALVIALGHNSSLRKPEIAKAYLEKSGPIYIINSEFTYQPGSGIVVNSQNRRIEINQLIDAVGLPYKNEILMLK
jgi:hypothetical protein